MTSTASTTAVVTLAAHALVIDLHTADPGDRISSELPIGIDLLLRQHLTSDPPRPEELTNAIGSVADHIHLLIQDWSDENAGVARTSDFSRIATEKWTARPFERCGERQLGILHGQRHDPLSHSSPGTIHADFERHTSDS